MSNFTDEALIAETMVWPTGNFFLMNIFFALKGSNFFIIISYGAFLERENEALYRWSRSHDQDGCHAHIW